MDTETTTRAASGDDAGGPGLARAAPYPPAALVPTQQAPRGIRYDFNLGARLTLPPGAWRVRLSDLDTGNILFETESKGAFVNSSKRFYVRFGIEVWESGESVFRHQYAAAGHAVLVQFPVGTLGDTLGWLPYAEKFRLRHRCRLTCAMAEWLIPLFAGAYPEIEFITHEAVDADR